MLDQKAAFSTQFYDIQTQKLFHTLVYPHLGTFMLEYSASKAFKCG